MDASVSNLIEPGDRVDVIAVLRETRENPTALAKTILKGVRVFAVNSEIVRSIELEDSPDEVRTVSLLLEPGDAEKVMMAAEMGTIKLAMLSPEDEVQVKETEGCTLNQVLGRAADWMLNRGSAASAAGLGHGSAHWSMVVSSPGVAHKYTWSSPGSQPQIETLYDEKGPSVDLPQTPDASDPAETFQAVTSMLSSE
jgi:hypothetical protein